MKPDATPSCQRRTLLLAAAGAFAQPWAQAGAPAADHTAIWRVLSRLGYGPTPTLVAQVHQAGGPRAWALREIDVAWSASRQGVRLDGLAGEFDAPLPEIFQRHADERMARRQTRDSAGTRAVPSMDAAASAAARYSVRVARQAAIWRLAACSRPELEHPLLARMTEFWFNHLNVSAGKGSVRPFAGHYLVNVIRTHALGRFDELLLASVRHPAMLHYLDQAQSVAEGTLQGTRRRGLNENYARELMELHTLGTGSGYTQKDVRELARVLTGWTVAPQAPDGFRFARRLHDDGTKTVLGQRFGGGGEAEGVTAIRMLAAHPATARRIALRLAQWFIADEPPAALTDALARSFMASGGDTRALLRTLIHSSAFRDPANTLFKTPYDFACSALTAVGGPQDEHQLQPAFKLLENAGQPVLRWPTPDGYRTDHATWLTPEALTHRADYALLLARHQPQVEFLADFAQPATLQRIDAQPASLRAGLLLASPDFMNK